MDYALLVLHVADYDIRKVQILLDLEVFAKIFFDSLFDFLGDSRIDFCFIFSWQANDILSSSLREFGVICLIAIIRRFSASPESAVILAHLTPLVKLGLKNPLEAVRNAFITVLGEIVDFNSGHALFRHLTFLHYSGGKKALNADKCQFCNGEGVTMAEASALSMVSDVETFNCGMDRLIARLFD